MDKIIEFNKEGLYLDSREIAEMMEIEHSNLIKKIDGINEDFRKVKIDFSKYWKESSYQVVGQTRNYRCFLITKRGCEFLAHKTTGTKGNLFTDKYMDRFEEMEEHLKNEQLLLANNKIKELKETVEEFKRLTEEAKQQYKPSHKRKLDYNRMIKMFTNNEEEAQVVKDWVFGVLNISKWEDTCVADSAKIMQAITAVVKLSSISKFQQLSLWDS